jgi:hypothetical protein
LEQAPLIEGRDSMATTSVYMNPVFELNEGQPILTKQTGDLKKKRRDSKADLIIKDIFAMPRGHLLLLANQYNPAVVKLHRTYTFKLHASFYWNQATEAEEWLLMGAQLEF